MTARFSLRPNQTVGSLWTSFLGNLEWYLLFPIWLFSIDGSSISYSVAASDYTSRLQAVSLFWQNRLGDLDFERVDVLAALLFKVKINPKLVAMQWIRYHHLWLVHCLSTIWCAFLQARLNIKKTSAIDARWWCCIIHHFKKVLDWISKAQIACTVM